MDENEKKSTPPVKDDSAEEKMPEAEPHEKKHRGPPTTEGPKEGSLIVTPPHPG